ncbi:MAG TPA: hypothetical protein VGB20_05400 [bacterium]
MSHGSLAATRMFLVSGFAKPYPGSRGRVLCLLLLAGWLVLALGAGPVLAQSGGNGDNPNKKGFWYNPNDTRGQGNMGKPDMRDPYGHDKDRDRSETGNQGRVIRVTDDPEPDPEPDPDPEPPPVVDLPAPEWTSVSWALGHAMVPLGLGWDLELHTDKQLLWSYPPTDTRVMGFHVYLQEPGDAGLRLYQDIGGDLPDGWHTDFLGQPGVTVYISRERGQLALIERRGSHEWQKGTYRHFIVPYDANGYEGAGSPELLCSVLEDVQMLHPASGEPVSPTPAFSWTDVTLPARDASSIGVSLVKLWDLAVRDPIWQLGNYDLTQTTALYDGAPLSSGLTYAVTADVWVLIARPEFGPSVGRTMDWTSFSVGK